MKKIKVIIKRPGEKPYSTWISVTDDNIQKTVEGMYGRDRITEGIITIFNAFGLEQGLPYNCTIQSAPYLGTVIFAGIQDLGVLYEFADIPIDFQEFKRMFPDLFKESAKENL